MLLPEQWPSYFSKAEGAEVWDLDGNRYIDMSYNGLGALVLGAADPDVDAAVKAAIDSGTASTLNCPEEVDLADLLCEIHPWADMARFARGGGEALAMAVRIARTSTGRDRVAFCGYHGWHDWYLAANLASDRALDGHLIPGLKPAGVPRGLEGTALPFHYNQLDELQAIVESHPGELAAIVMEPIRFNDPEAGFLEGVRRIADETGAVLIFDEVTLGFRINSGGIHLVYEVLPDMAVFAKAIGNGYPIAATIGREEVMQAAQDSFISSTNWTERVGYAAALATIRKHRRENVPQHLMDVGSRLQEGLKTVAAEAELNVHVSGMPPMTHFEFEYPSKQALHTLFTQMMLDRGFLAASSFYATYAHQYVHIDSYVDAVREVFPLLAEAIHSDTVEEQLRGPVAHTGFQRLT